MAVSRLELGLAVLSPTCYEIVMEGAPSRQWLLLVNPKKQEDEGWLKFDLTQL